MQRAGSSREPGVARVGRRPFGAGRSGAHDPSAARLGCAVLLRSHRTPPWATLGRPPCLDLDRDRRASARLPSVARSLHSIAIGRAATRFSRRAARSSRPQGKRDPTASSTPTTLLWGPARQSTRPVDAGRPKRGGEGSPARFGETLDPDDAGVQGGRGAVAEPASKNRGAIRVSPAKRQCAPDRGAPDRGAPTGAAERRSHGRER